MTEVRNRDSAPLNWDVFVTPGIPIATKDLPPGANQAMFQAIASTLIYGKQGAILVDAFMTIKQADDLVDWISASGMNLTQSILHTAMATTGLESELFLNASQMLKQ
jgi:hypothetical protein